MIFSLLYLKMGLSSQFNKVYPQLINQLINQSDPFDKQGKRFEVYA